MQRTRTQHIAETGAQGILQLRELHLGVVLVQHRRQLLVRDRGSRVDALAASDRFSNLAVARPVQGVRGGAVYRIRVGCDFRVLAHAGTTRRTVEQGDDLFAGDGAVRLEGAGLRVGQQPLLLVGHANVVGVGVVAGHVFKGGLQDLGFGHGDACGDLVGDFLTPGVGADIQLQGVVHTLGLNEFDREQVGSAEGVFVTVEFGGERPGAQGFEGVIAHVAVAHGQGGAFGEEFTQAVRGVADGHSVFGDGGALDGEARTLGLLGGGRGLGGLGGFICVCSLGLQCEGACCGGSGGTLQEESS